jgi:hypothetical protein
MIMEDRPLTIYEVADEVGISRGSANTILTEDLGMGRAAAKSVPRDSRGDSRQQPPMREEPAKAQGISSQCSELRLTNHPPFFNFQKVSPNQLWQRRKMNTSLWFRRSN